MIVKIVMLFLVGIGVLGMFGKLRMPKVPRIASKKCAACGAPRVGKGPCPCGRA
ncbi:hypothetical protein [Anianabacter salinae]|uniref:hypothetical protein n=1 Tax=Anianabacter salinae TaxID=2851023 RepID=UPI00225E6E0C|nr:hypothetical protein [Anianabacter salinae]MBV0910891.1 hypothetical protein [Anianabacter salinae]